MARSFEGLLAISIVMALTACSPPEPAPSVNALHLESSSPAWSDEELMQRIRKSPHSYFRFINAAFAREVCRRFEPVMPSLPTVNLHGDAHLEQVAVTPQSFGLADFDDSASGPPVIDLVRFGVSIELALRERGWQKESDRVYEDFMRAYRLGLSDPSEAPPNPALVDRIRSDLESSAGSFLDRAESRMRPVSGQEKLEAEKGYARYVDLMLRIHPTWTESLLRLKRWGLLNEGGLGSATTMRYLLRIEGSSSAPEDDLILEAKELRDLSGVPCVAAQRGDALRIIASAVRFGRQPDPFLAIIPRGPGDALDAPPWWIQSWSPSYSELDIEKSLQSLTELTSVLETAGYQMARGHTNLLPPPYDRQLRELVKMMLRQRRRAIRRAILDLTELTLDAHRGLGAASTGSSR